mgnify:FL=1
MTRSAAILLAVIFLYSSFSKVGHIDTFQTVIESYGLPQFSFMAPIIVLFELALGLLLIANFKPKVCGMLTFVSVAAFTLAFAYANIFHGVKDCGCFGDNPLLNTKPILVYVRNVVLMALAVFMMMRGTEDSSLKPWFKVAFCLVIVVAAFFEGRSFRTPESLAPTHPLFGKPLADTQLSQYLTLDKDSTYAVYVFSYDCPSCWDSMNNFMQYEKANVAQRIIGINVGGKGKKHFMEIFNPDFQIIEVGAELAKSIRVVPTFLYIKGGVIEDIIQGKAIHPDIFKHTYLESK